MAHNQFDLLKTKRFLPFFLTQFLGAFNDNLFKNALAVMIAYQIFAGDVEISNRWVNIAQGLFILPFFIFSAMAGQLADKYDKAFLMRQIKLFEIFIMLLAALAFYLKSVEMLVSVLFLMGTQSAFFGPVKYAILPQHLKPQELLGGNGLVEMGTFVAILVGTLTGGILIAKEQGTIIVSIAIVIAAIVGYSTSRSIPKAEASDSQLKINWNIFAETLRVISHARTNKTVFLSVIGISWFWFFGAIILTQMPNFAKVSLGGNNEVFTLLLVSFSLGVAIGSLLCEKLSGRRVEIGLVPFGALGLSLFTLDLFLATFEPAIGSLVGWKLFLQQMGSYRILFDVTLIGIFGGFYIVPLYALVQQRSEDRYRSRIIAANNILNAGFMVVAAIISIVLLGSGLTIPQLFLANAIMNGLVAIYICKTVPEFLMRFLIWVMLHTIYRVKHSNLDNIPTEGAAVLVCNHVSFVDALILAGFANRPVRFVMDHQIFKTPVLGFIFRTAKAIPIASEKEDPDMKKRAFDIIDQALRDGELVMIFPEGKITFDGEMNVFRKGIEEIIERTPVPVIPMALRGLWGSFFSRKDGAAMSGMPRRFFSKIELVAGSAIAPQNVTAKDLQEKITNLRGDMK